MFTSHSACGTIVLLLYVDDIILTGSNMALLTSFISVLSAQFAMKDLGSLSFFLGIETTRTPTSLFLCQQCYVLDLLSRTGMVSFKPCHTLIVAGSKQSLYDGVPLPDGTEYCRIVGSLQYLTLTRPDISYVIHQVSQFMHAPTDSHLQAVKHILHYLKSTVSLGLLLRPITSFILTAFSDADWARCPDDRWSTSGHCIFLSPNLISWSCKKQPTVSHFSVESEYRPLAIVAADTSWIRFLLRGLGVSPPTLILLYCDNVSATYMALNPVFHTHTKHMEIDYHFLRELVVDGIIKVLFLFTTDQVVDIFTEGLPHPRFEVLRDKLTVCSHPA